MSESTHDADATTPDQPQSWDAILSQPISRIKNDATMGDGGWRAVQDISSFSPRSQDVPAQIPAPDAMLRLHMPAQAEEDAAPTAKLPESLADQLSLTWAARKQTRPQEPEPETVTPSWPSSTPAAPSMAAPQQTIAAQTPTAAPRQETPAPRAEAPLWRRPLDLVTRALGRKESPPAATPQATQPPTPAAPAAASAPAAQPQAQTPQSPAAASPAQPRATVQRMAEPSAPASRPRVEASAPATEAAPTQPQAAQESAPPLDLTLAKQPARTETPNTTVESIASNIETPAPQATPTIQRLAESPAAPTPAAGIEAPAPAPTPAQPTPRSLSEAPSVSDAAPVVPEVQQPERRSFLSWLRPRDVARAPVDRPRAPDAAPAPQAPAPPAATQPIQRTFDTPRAPTATPSQRPAQTAQQPSTSLPTAGAPLTHRATPATPASSSDEPSHVDAPVISRLDAGPSSAPSAATPPAAQTASPPAPASAPETGDPLPASLQQRMEGLLDVPLREVRVFRGQTSQRVTSQLKADAVTMGNQIHVAPGRGDTSTPQGRALIGHELSHVATRQGAPEPVSRLDDASPAAPIAPAMPLPANVTPHEDESRAMRLEHAILRSEAAPAQQQAPRPAPAAPRPLSLSHRAPPPQIVVSPEAASGGFGVHPDGWGGQGAAFEAALNGAAAAPWDRLADQAESAATSAASSAIDSGMSAASGAVSSAVGAAKDAAGGAMGDEEGLIDRVVDAVMTRIQHEGDVARERSSAFVPHFGG